MLKRNWRTYKLDLAREATKGPSPLSIKLEKVSVVPAEHIFHYFFVFLYYAVAIAREGRWVIFWISVFFLSFYHIIVFLQSLDQGGWWVFFFALWSFVSFYYIVVFCNYFARVGGGWFFVCLYFCIIFCISTF